jgi:gas vesicle protein
MDNQSDKFGSGFLAGTIFGGIVGGFVGVFLANKLAQTLDAEDPDSKQMNGINGKLPKHPPLREGAELNIEMARQGLETKIAQLNNAIDDVRSQLSNISQRE